MSGDCRASRSKRSLSSMKLEKLGSKDGEVYVKRSGEMVADATGEFMLFMSKEFEEGVFELLFCCEGVGVGVGFKERWRREDVLLLLLIFDEIAGVTEDDEFDADGEP